MIHLAPFFGRLEHYQQRAAKAFVYVMRERVTTPHWSALDSDIDLAARVREAHADLADAMKPRVS